MPEDRKKSALDEYIDKLINEHEADEATAPGWQLGDLLVELASVMSTMCLEVESIHIVPCGAAGYKATLVVY